MMAFVHLSFFLFFLLLYQLATLDSDSHRHLLSGQLLVPNHYIHCYKQESV